MLRGANSGGVCNMFDMAWSFTVSENDEVAGDVRAADAEFAGAHGGVKDACCACACDAWACDGGGGAFLGGAFETATCRRCWSTMSISS